MGITTEAVDAAGLLPSAFYKTVEFEHLFWADAWREHCWKHFLPFGNIQSIKIFIKTLSERLKALVKSILKSHHYLRMKIATDKWRISYTNTKQNILKGLLGLCCFTPQFFLACNTLYIEFEAIFLFIFLFFFHHFQTLLGYIVTTKVMCMSKTIRSKIVDLVGAVFPRWVR